MTLASGLRLGPYEISGHRGDAFEAPTPRRLFDVPLPEPRRNRFVVTLRTDLASW